MIDWWARVEKLAGRDLPTYQGAMFRVAEVAPDRLYVTPAVSRKRRRISREVMDDAHRCVTVEGHAATPAGLRGVSTVHKSYVVGILRQLGL